MHNEFIKNLLQGLQGGGGLRAKGRMSYKLDEIDNLDALNELEELNEIDELNEIEELDAKMH